MQKIKDIIAYLEGIAPLSYQESYDNSGLIVGNSNTEVTGVLITLDSTEAVIEEAITKKCNLVIAHHPIVFKGLKKLTGKNYVERTVLQAIKNDIAIYAIHTNLDNIINGVNQKIAQKLNLGSPGILAPKQSLLSKLTVFVPKKNTAEVLNAIHKAGAGNIGNYQNCSFTVNGTGAFIPNDLANPHIGRANSLEEVNEDRIEVILPSHLEKSVSSAMINAHPYEEVAHFITPLHNLNQEVGSGMIGELEQEMSGEDFLKFLKKSMSLNIIRHTAIPKKVKRIAICGGAGSFLLGPAIRNNADVFITGDFKYHEFFDADNHLMICDIGHYESEVYTKELIYELLNENFSTFALNLSEVNTNPISYF